jgi:S-adenosyl-L-methionine hydrolase (adenosine-forming)
MPERPLIALLTDFGTRDAYVGVMKGVMKSLCQDAEFIDITHDIPPQDVRAAAFTLHNNYSYFPEDTVFLVVVDPGVGTARRAVLWQSADGYRFVFPDNGVLTYIMPASQQPTPSKGTSWKGGKMQVNVIRQRDPLWEITASPLRGTPSTTFHGRDIFAPMAAIAACARLEAAMSSDKLRPIKKDTLVQLAFPRQTTSEDTITGEVLYIDHFGNIVTSIGRLIWRQAGGLGFDPAFVHNLPQLFFPPESTVKLGSTALDRIHRTYGEVEAGELLALVGSSGYLEISVNGGNAATQLGSKVGDTVTLHISEGG